MGCTGGVEREVLNGIFMNTQVCIATQKEKGFVLNLVPYYIYDMSEYMGWAKEAPVYCSIIIPALGLFGSWIKIRGLVFSGKRSSAGIQKANLLDLRNSTYSLIQADGPCSSIDLRAIVS